MDAVRLLVDKCPNSVRHADETGALPLHNLSGNSDCDKEESVGILRLMLELYPEAASVRSNPPSLPIHIALRRGYQGRTMSAEFCKILIDAYPECVTIASGRHGMPIHHAVRIGHLEVIEHILKLCPDSVGMRSGSGFFPIHQAAFLGEAQSQVFSLLLEYDPNGLSRVVEASDAMRGENNILIALQGGIEYMNQQLDSLKYEGCLSLHLACASGQIDTVRFLAQKYPEALWARSAFGYLPIHEVSNRECGTGNAEIVQYLLEQDPDGASKTVTDAPGDEGAPYEDYLPLLWHAQKLHAEDWDDVPALNLPLILMQHRSSLILTHMQSTITRKVMMALSSIDR